METYKVKVLTPGHMLIFKGKRSRTPVTFSNVRKEEISLIDAQARRSLLKYEVTLEVKEEKKSNFEQEIILEKDEATVEKLSECKEPSTILESLLAKSEK